MRVYTCLLSTAAVIVLLTGSVEAATPLAAKAGTLEIKFLYMPPETVDPTYHTAIWLEDESGKLIKTLFVSQELSSTEYKLGAACPDWVKQANWSKAEKSTVDATTGPTPSVGSGTLKFDLQKLGIPPGTYQFRFQVHVVEQYNILFRGKLSVGTLPDEAKIETLYSPAKHPSGTDYVRDVQVRYTPAADEP